MKREREYEGGSVKWEKEHKRRVKRMEQRRGI
jgi:hypothetical protein